MRFIWKYQTRQFIRDAKSSSVAEIATHGTRSEQMMQIKKQKKKERRFLLVNKIPFTLLPLTPRDVAANGKSTPDEIGWVVTKLQIMRWQIFEQKRFSFATEQQSISQKVGIHLAKCEVKKVVI